MTSPERPLKTLIFIPTYNERDNAPAICREILGLGLDADLLFVDDNSPDGTGQIMDEMAKSTHRLMVRHRSGKLGIGSAHQEAIFWAYEQGYQRVISLDCDFTHAPSDIPRMMEKSREVDMVVGSRWLAKDSLPGWNIFRKSMTTLGHFLTKTMLGLPHDATGAFRIYRIDRISREIFELVQSTGYAFFYKSLFILKANGVSISDVPIVLPARTYGSSKMTTDAAWRSLKGIFQLRLAYFRHPERFQKRVREVKIDPALIDPQDWDAYWNQKSATSAVVYELAAAVYRKTFIQPRLNHIIRATFEPGSKLIHGGCGSGQVDRDFQDEMRLTAVDISPGALDLYQRNNPQSVEVRHGSIFDLPFADESFDGYYNMGVLEHFTHEEISQILAEAYRVVRKGGRLVIFWPHSKAPSVFVLHLWHWLLGFSGGKRLHPPEISLVRSKAETLGLFEKAGFRVKSYSMGPSDLFIQAAIVAEK